MSGMLFGCLIPWWMGIIFVAAFMFVDSKDLDLRQHANSVVTWAEGRSPMALTFVLAFLKKALQRKNSSGDQPRQQHHQTPTQPEDFFGDFPTDSQA